MTSRPATLPACLTVLAIIATTNLVVVLWPGKIQRVDYSDCRPKLAPLLLPSDTSELELRTELAIGPTITAAAAADFIILPAMIVQNAIRDDAIITFPLAPGLLSPDPNEQNLESNW